MLLNALSDVDPIPVFGDSPEEIDRTVDLLEDIPPNLLMEGDVA